MCKDILGVPECPSDMMDNQITPYVHFRLTMAVKAPMRPSEWPYNKWRLHYTGEEALIKGEYPTDMLVTDDYDLAFRMPFTL